MIKHEKPIDWIHERLMLMELQKITKMWTIVQNVNDLSRIDGYAFFDKDLKAIIACKWRLNYALSSIPEKGVVIDVHTRDFCLAEAKRLNISFYIMWNFSDGLYLFRDERQSFEVDMFQCRPERNDPDDEGPCYFIPKYLLDRKRIGNAIEELSIY